MSDPNTPAGDHDPVDRAYAEAEAMLRDDAERAARRARVLAAVAAAQAEAEPTPAPPRKMARQPAPWLMAAGVAGVAALVGLRIAPTAVERPSRVEPAPAAAPPAPDAFAAKDAAPPPATTSAPIAARAAESAPLPAPVQARASAIAAAQDAPPPLSLPPVASRVETPTPPPPPLPIPPAARRMETPAPAAAMASAGREFLAPFSIANPEWVRRPNGDDVAQYYPERAQRTDTNGSVILSCAVKANGTLEGCTIVSETPADYGFGDAALKLARIFRMKPQTSDSAPVEGGMVRVPIEFKVPN